MAKITIRDKTIRSDGDAPYVIAEIGCNHDGDFGKALTMIKTAADCGVDAVKFQKRSPQKMFTPEALAAPYDSPNAHGATYGEHRQALDWFGWSEFLKISECCFDNNVAFICTPFTSFDAEFLAHPDLELDAFKIASCDLTNVPLIRQVSGYGLPVIISTGGGAQKDILDAADAVTGLDGLVAVLHCVSVYPNSDDDLNLSKLATLSGMSGPHGVCGFCEHEFSGNHQFVIGFSSHHPGLLPHYIAYMQGARIFEAHFTLNRGGKGTDHGFSLEPAGMRQLCEDLRRIPRMLGNANRRLTHAEVNGFVKKMGKSIYASKDIPSGDLITTDNVELRSPAEGLPPYLLDGIIGCRVTRSITAGNALYAGDIAEGPADG